MAVPLAFGALIVGGHDWALRAGPFPLEHWAEILDVLGRYSGVVVADVPVSRTDDRE